uniref:DNA-directed RNA polymerases I, II, and III subunit RPABC5 n=1 Tax=Salvator merianae TaxID=96440 RepID=A0A8D0C739_SALMN
MIISVRCFTCGKIVGNTWEAYLGLLQVVYAEGSDALDALGLKRYCCWCMLFAHVDLIEKLLNYTPLEKEIREMYDAQTLVFKNCCSKVHGLKLCRSCLVRDFIF